MHMWKSAQNAVVPSADKAVAWSSKVNGSGQECPLHASHSHFGNRSTFPLISLAFHLFIPVE